MKQIITFLLILILATSCQNRFVTKSYENRKFTHHKVAVVPIESIYTGKIPDSLSTEQIRAIEDAESLRFQSLIHSRLIQQSGLRNREIAIDIISPTIVRAKLDAAGVSTRAAATMSAIELAQVLEVDVIARGNVTMNRFLSDMESLAIDAVETIAREVLRGLGSPAGIPNTNLRRTYRIDSYLELLDGMDGSVLWKTSLVRNADWSYRPEDAVASLASQHASAFPYRNREFRNR